MNKSAFTKFISQDRPAIELNPYDYSREGFEGVINELKKYFEISPYQIAFGLESYTAFLLIEGEEVEVDMDNWYFIISFQTESLRDQCYEKLTRTL